MLLHKIKLSDEGTLQLANKIKYEYLYILHKICDLQI